MATQTAGAAPASIVQLVLLKRADGTGIPAFNQGLFTNSQCNIPPPYDKDSNQKQRNVHTSGCGLCARVSYLAAAKCLVPQYDPSTYALTSPLTASHARCEVRDWYDSRDDALMPPELPPLIDPGTFMQYLKNYIDSQARGDAAKKTMLSKSIFAPDPKGALAGSSADLIAAVNELVALSGLASVNVFAPGVKTDRWFATGTDIPDVTASINSNSPVVLGVEGAHAQKDGDSAPPKPIHHQVLAVGYLKSGSQTYYVIADSGFNDKDAYPALGGMVGPINKAAVLKYTASTSRTNPYKTITWYQPMQGLEQATGLVAEHREKYDGPARK